MTAREKVCPAVDIGAFPLFGRHIGGAAHLHPCPGQIGGGIGEMGQAEIAQESIAVAVEEHILRLDVTMDHALQVLRGGLFNWQHLLIRTTSMGMDRSLTRTLRGCTREMLHGDRGAPHVIAQKSRLPRMWGWGE